MKPFVSGIFVLSLFAVIFTPFAVDAKNSSSYIIVPTDRSRISDFNVFSTSDLTKTVSKLTLPKENKGQYVTRGDSYSKSILMNDEKAYVVGHRSDGGAERNLGYYLFELSKNGTVKKSSFLGTGCDWEQGVIDQQNKKIAAIPFEHTSIQLFDIAHATLKSFTYPLKKNFGVNTILAVNGDIVTVVVDRTEVDAYTKEAKAVSINLATKKIVSIISYTKYVATHKNPVVYTCPVFGNSCTLTINNKKVSSKNTSLYSSRYFTTVINTTLLGYTATGYAFVGVSTLFSK